MSGVDEIFIECVGTRNVDAILEYKSDVSTGVLKNMRMIAKRKRYYEIVEIIDDELANRDD